MNAGTIVVFAWPRNMVFAFISVWAEGGWGADETKKKTERNVKNVTMNTNKLLKRWINSSTFSYSFRFCYLVLNLEHIHTYRYSFYPCCFSGYHCSKIVSHRIPSIENVNDAKRLAIRLNFPKNCIVFSYFLDNSLFLLFARMSQWLGMCMRAESSCVKLCIQYYYVIPSVILILF